MKVGDLVILKIYKRRIGIVKSKAHRDLGLIRVYWQDGDQTWCLSEQLQAVKKCP